jgi:hypothetical protein
MNSAHWHLLLNHLPLTGTIFSTLLLATGLIFKNQSMKNSGLALFILTALCTIPVFLTGEGAEDVLESIGQKNEHFIHEHEEIASIAFYISQAIAIISIGALLLFKNKKRLSIFLTAIALLAGLGNSILMIQVGNSGGQIRHTEIRNVN